MKTFKILVIIIALFFAYIFINTYCSERDYQKGYDTALHDAEFRKGCGWWCWQKCCPMGKMIHNFIACKTNMRFYVKEVGGCGSEQNQLMNFVTQFLVGGQDMRVVFVGENRSSFQTGPPDRTSCNSQKWPRYRL